MTLFFRLFAGCILQLLPFSVLCLYPFSGHYKAAKRVVYLHTGAIIIFLGILFSSASMFLGFYAVPASRRFLTSNLLFMLCLIPCLIWYLYIVNDIWQKKLFVFSFTVISAISMTSLNNTITTFIHKDTNLDGFPYQGIALPVLFAFTIVTLPALVLLLKNEFIPLADYMTAREYRSLCILSAVLFFILASCFIPISYSYMLNPMTIFLYSALMIAVFIIYFMVFRIFHLSKNQLFAERKLYESETQFKIQADQYQQLMNQINEIKRIRHDYRHHLIAIQNYAISGESQKLQNYLREHLAYTDELSIDKYCDNEAVNFLVSHYMALSKEHHITMSPVIQCPASLTISTPELSVLLGNLLENAYTAALNAAGKDRYIKLNILHKGKLLIITLDNGFSGQITPKDHTYLSTKTNHEGLGLESIRSIVQKHDGTAQFSHKDTEFHADILVRG